MANTGNSDQTDLGFPKVIPPERALVTAPPRRPRVSAREQTGTAVVAVEGATENVVDAIVVPPPIPAPPRAPHGREFVSEKLAALGLYHDVHIIEYDDRSFRSVRVKGGLAWWSFKRTRWILLGAALFAAGGTSPKWIPWAMATWEARSKPTVAAPPATPAPIPKPRRLRPKKEPLLFERLFGP